jgi:hypothetical protein
MPILRPSLVSDRNLNFSGGYALLLIAALLWAWASRGPITPEIGTVVDYVEHEQRTFALIQLDDSSGRSSFFRRTKPGVLFELGESVEVHRVPSQPEVVADWGPTQRRQWGLACAWVVVVLLALTLGRVPAVRRWRLCLVGLVCVAQLLAVVVERAWTRVDLLVNGRETTAVIANHEFTTVRTSRTRGARVWPDTVVHFIAADARPPRDVLVTVPGYIPGEGSRVGSIYLADTPTIATAIPIARWRLWLMPVAALMMCLALAALVWWLRPRREDFA